jgi:hypothetical protein
MSYHVSLWLTLYMLPCPKKHREHKKIILALLAMIPTPLMCGHMWPATDQTPNMQGKPLPVNKHTRHLQKKERKKYAPAPGTRSQAKEGVSFKVAAG